MKLCMYDVGWNHVETKYKNPDIVLQSKLAS